MKRPFHLLLPVLLASPASAHDIAAGHSHVGDAVLVHMHPLAAIGLGVAAGVVTLLLLRARGARKARERRHDPR